MSAGQPARRPLQRLRIRGGRAKYLIARAGRRAAQHLDPLRDPFDPGRKRHFPADLDQVDSYQDRFVATARLFEVFVRRCTWSSPAAGDGAVAIVILPWYGTPVPWYAVAVGLGLARRGRPVVFVWHDVPFPDPSSEQVPQYAEIERIFRRLGRRFPVMRLSSLPDAEHVDPNDDQLLDRLAQDNLTWFNRGGVPSDADLDLRDRVRSSLALALPKVRTLYRSSQFSCSITSGGMIGSSGLYLNEGAAAGVRTATFDAGLGDAAVDVNGAATQHPDAVQAFEWMSAQDPATRAAAVTAAREEFSRRRAGLDPDQYQVSPGRGSAGAANNILIPLSVIFDQAALGKNHIFADSAEWLVTTIRTLLDETDDEIIVRQHPSERRRLERSAFDVTTLLRESFGASPQVRLVAAEEPVSTYDLLDPSRLVLPFVSTIGIEAAALGKPVILSGSAYYAGLGFVWAPQTREEYLDLVARGARGELRLLPDQVALAWQSYYLSAVCHRVWTDFTPQPHDFWRWVARDPAELYDDPDVGDILTALADGTPLALLRHARYRAAASVPAPEPTR